MTGTVYRASPACELRCLRCDVQCAVITAVRDRRWAQGNIQHLKLLGSDGFHPVNRLQLAIGASAYMTSPAWLVLILATIAHGPVEDPLEAAPHPTDAPALAPAA